MQEPSDSCPTCGHVKHRIVIVTDLMPADIHSVECTSCGTLRLKRLNPIMDNHAGRYSFGVSFKGKGWGKDAK